MVWHISGLHYYRINISSGTSRKKPHPQAESNLALKNGDVLMAFAEQNDWATKPLFFHVDRVACFVVQLINNIITC